MGSKSSSSSSTTTKTEQRDERVAASDNAVVLQLQDGASIDLADPGAFELAGDLVDALTAAGDQVFDLADEATDLVRSTFTQQQEFLRDQDPSLSVAKDALKIAVPLGLAYMFFNGGDSA